MYSYINDKDKGVLTVIPLEKPWINWTVDQSNPNYEAIKAALFGDDISFEEMEALVSPAATIAKYTEDYLGIQVLGGVLYYEGQEVGSALANRILDSYHEGFPVKHWALFAEKVFRNPAEWAKEEIYLWLEASDLPILPDGNIMAYKWVTNEYKDIRTGKFDNSIGATPSMPREEVDPVRDRTCSRGLHFCSKGYLGSYGGGGNRVVILSVNPEDIISIPSDYNNSKGRACKYTVIGEIDPAEAKEKSWPAIEFGFPEPAKLIEADDPKDNKPVKKGVSIETIHGEIHESYWRNAMKKHHTMAAWADSHSWSHSTIRSWKKRLLAAGAKLD